MKRNNPTMSDYLMVETLARLKSFKGAADELARSPSSLSRQLVALEIQLGAKIFDRDTRNISLTASGKLFVQASKTMLNTEESALMEFKSHLKANQGRLVIASLPSVSVALLPRLLKNFALKYPHVDLRIYDSLSDNVIEAVDSGNAEIGFTAGTVSARSKLSFLPLIKDSFVAISSKHEFLAENQEYKLEKLMEMPNIAMVKGTSVREMIDEVCKKKKLKFSPRFEVEHLVTAEALVANGLGITILPNLTLPILHTENLAIFKIQNLSVERSIGLVYRSGKSLSPAARRFLEHTRNEIIPLYKSID